MERHLSQNVQVVDLVIKCCVGVNTSFRWNSSSGIRHEFIVISFVCVLYDRRLSIIVRKGSNDVE